MIKYFHLLERQILPLNEGLVGNLSIRETSQALEISESAVKLRLLRARLALREMLSVYYGKELAMEKI